MITVAKGQNPLLALKVDSLKKRYRSTEALRGASFDMQSGQRLALVGPNGAGKTTLIRCIAGRTQPNEGTIELLGQCLPPTGGREQLGLVPQDLAIYSDLTARENLVAFARFHALRGKVLAEQVEWALQWTRLADRQHELVSGFSGGMKRRVNLACGVMHRPRVLLLDEPTVGVDPQSRQQIFQMLDELHASGTSILLTTHHLDEAEQCCDRIVIIDHGLVIADGTVSQLVDSTIGSSRHIKLRIDKPLCQPLAPWHVGQSQLGQESTGHTLETRVTDVAGQISGLLESVRSAGHEVLDVEIRAPSLHDVFLHLTGRELRD